MAKITHTFAVYITADEPTEDNGYTPEEVERLLKTTLNWYSGPLNKERGGVVVDYELISAMPAGVPPGAALGIKRTVPR
jgi:hypothetical protein